MSRLAFEETVEGDDELVYSDNDDIIDLTNISSYNLMQIPPSPSVQSETVSVSSIQESVATEDSTVSKKKSKKKKKKNKAKNEQVSGIAITTNQTTSSTVEHAVDSAPSTTPAKTPSKWLTSFLSQKRQATVLPTPPTVPLQNTFIELFAASTPKDAVESEEESSEPEEDVFQHGDLSITLPNDDSDSVKLKIYNLPYTITSEDIIATASKHGVIVSSVTLDYSKANKRPAGSATIEVMRSYDEDDDDVISSLHGKEFGGRSVRIEKFDTRVAARKSFTETRYFDDNISCKCTLCGRVGHKHQDCVFPPLPIPCHLCARTDHEPYDCPNITCFRCGDFGHHSRTCTAPRMDSQHRICTYCGSMNHTKKLCYAQDPMYHIESKNIRCMCCNQLGHAMCKSINMNDLPDTAVYCPSCGEKGHNMDISPGTCSNPGEVFYGSDSDESLSVTNDNPNKRRRKSMPFNQQHNSRSPSPYRADSPHFNRSNNRDSRDHRRSSFPQQRNYPQSFDPRVSQRYDRYSDRPQRDFPPLPPTPREEQYRNDTMSGHKRKRHGDERNNSNGRSVSYGREVIANSNRKSSGSPGVYGSRNYR